MTPADLDAWADIESAELGTRPERWAPFVAAEREVRARELHAERCAAMLAHWSCATLAAYDGLGLALDLAEGVIVRIASGGGE